MILIGLGANLPTERYGAPRATLMAALAALGEAGVAVEARSPWYRSAPVPAGDQPWFVNAVAAVATRLGPAELLKLMHGIERDFGRVRREVNEPRPLDLDLLAYGDRIQAADPVLPHPRLHQRGFVLLPLRDIAPRWRHPSLGLTVDELIARLPMDQPVEPLQD